MKKALLILALALIGSAPLLLASGIGFTGLADNPLFREPSSDPYSFTSQLGIIRPADALSSPMEIMACVSDPETGKSSYVSLPIRSNAVSDPEYLNMKAGTSLGLLRTDLGFVKAELSLAGYINTVFEGFGGTDCLGLDGSCFLGFAIQGLDCLTLRFGLHHFSGHYGDEILETYYSTNSAVFEPFMSTIDVNGKTMNLSGPVQYVRDNSYLMSLSCDGPLGLRAYAQAELPRRESWIRPFAHVPSGYTNPSTHTDLIDRIGGSEAISADQKADENALKTGSSYRGWRLNGGLEWSVLLKDMTLLAGLDLQAHQDGQTAHQIGSYDPSRQWETELTATIAIMLKSALGARSLGLWASYHDGRFPLLNFFYQRTQCLSIGLRVY